MFQYTSATQDHVLQLLIFNSPLDYRLTSSEEFRLKHKAFIPYLAYTAPIIPWNDTNLLVTWGNIHTENPVTKDHVHDINNKYGRYTYINE